MKRKMKSLVMLALFLSFLACTEKKEQEQNGSDEASVCVENEKNDSLNLILTDSLESTDGDTDSDSDEVVMRGGKKSERTLLGGKCSVRSGIVYCNCPGWSGYTLASCKHCGHPNSKHNR